MAEAPLGTKTGTHTHKHTQQHKHGQGIYPGWEKEQGIGEGGEEVEEEERGLGG